MTTIILRGQTQRAYAHSQIDAAEPNSVVTVKGPSRNEDQNALMWVLLQDIAKAQPEGRKWVPETWKCAFMHALGHAMRFETGIDNTGPFPVGYRSSRLTVRQMADLITCIQEYGDRHGVKWSER